MLYVTGSSKSEVAWNIRTRAGKRGEPGEVSRHQMLGRYYMPLERAPC